MQTQWAAAFPPYDPSALVRWLVTVHTGSMFAYPCGGRTGASSLTLLLFVVGAGVLWYRGRKVIVLTCLAPLRWPSRPRRCERYPYGGRGRTVRPRGSCNTLCRASASSPASAPRPLLDIFRIPGVAPRASECGPGRARRDRDRPPGRRCLSPFPFDPRPAGSPVRTPVLARVRPQEAEPVCLRWDLGLGEWDSTNLNVAVYLCNQRIYSPQRQEQGNPRWQPSPRAAHFVACCPWPIRPAEESKAGSMP